MAGFRKANKAKAKLRAAVFGPSGSGKTFTSLRIASGLGGRIALIDTERGSASKYADRFDFDVCDPESRTIDAYVAAIHEAAQAEYAILVIDSLTHAWQELLDDVERIAKARYKGNTWSAWSEGTPKQRRLVNAMLDYPGHILATMRSKTAWESESSNGKSRPVRIGLAPEQGKGIEYEFDLLLELSVDHQAAVLKDRTGRYQDRIIALPGEDFGRELAAWLAEGSEVPVVPSQANPPLANPPPAQLDYVTWAENVLAAANSKFHAQAARKHLEIRPDSIGVNKHEFFRHQFKVACAAGLCTDPGGLKTGGLLPILADVWKDHADLFREDARTKISLMIKASIQVAENEAFGDGYGNARETDPAIADA